MVFDLFNTKEMEENYQSNRGLLIHKGFQVNSNLDFINHKLSIEVVRGSLFLDPIVFFNNLEERLSYEKMKREIKSL